MPKDHSPSGISRRDWLTRAAALAAKGVCFERACVPIPQRAPSWAAMLTGRYPHRTGAYSNSRVRLTPGISTIADVLRSAGYRCGLAGALPTFAAGITQADGWQAPPSLPSGARPGHDAGGEPADDPE